MLPPNQFLTARLTLRPPQMEDAPAIFERWAQDPEVTRNMTWLPHEDIQVTQLVLRRMIDAWSQGTRFPYVILETQTQQAVGMIELRPEEHQAEIGYVLARAYWGKGYMPEAARALVQWALSQPQVYRVYATTAVENLQSQRVMEKIGMTREGLLRRHVIHPAVSPEPLDSYLYAIVR
ncbi:MAG: GNAT family N-acetyltransferase [Anaerolineales bacterium]